MLEPEDHQKSRAQLLDDLRTCRARMAAYQKRKEQELADLHAAFGRLLIEASLAGVRLATPEANAILASQRAQGEV